MEIKLSRIELGMDILEERKPKIFVYPNSDELRSAMLFTQEWTGARAFVDYNIVTSSNLDWAKRTLAHEITHLLVREVVFGPFGDIPMWLSEGLAEYAEGENEEYQSDILNQAVENDTLISIANKKSPHGWGHIFYAVSGTF